LDFNTGQTIKRRTIIQVPINEIVINLVHKLAEADGIKEGLKITNKKNVILYDTSWIIGLDYYNANYEDEQDTSKQERDRRLVSTPKIIKLKTKHMEMKKLFMKKIPFLKNPQIW
jgi:hypothetical protein